MPGSVCEAVAGWASVAPDRLALMSSSGERVSYGLLDERAQCAAASLSAELGIAAGDVVVLSAGGGVEFVAVYLGVHRVGAVAVPLAADVPPARVAEIAEALSAKLVLSSQSAYAGLNDAEAAPQEGGSRCEAWPESGDLADVMFTSGTTGGQKAVMLTHGNLMGAVANINGFIGTCESDIEVVALPLSHSFGLGRVRCCLVAGATVVVVDGFARPKQLFTALEGSGATGFSMVPAAWRLLQRLSGDRLGRLDGHLRYVELGSAWMSPAEKQELAELLPGTRVIMHYGLTEASRATFLDFGRDRDRLDSVGRPGPLVEIGVFAIDGQRLDAGVEGEICVRGPMVTSGYLGDPARSASAFHDDWFRTGDVGMVDEDGFVMLRGRVDEMINVGGRKVAPQEIEDALLALDEVADVACVGVPDPVAGYRVKAFVCWVGDPLEVAELQGLLRARLEPYKVPAELEPVAVIPRTSSGKIQRLKLLEGADV